MASSNGNRNVYATTPCMAKRDWKSYNERLVKRGELLLGFDFLDSWDEELEEMNSRAS